MYKSQEVELAGYTTCGGCPGGNVEYCIGEMKKNRVETVHFATGMVVGYPPCPHIDHFYNLTKQKYNVDVIIGTHPIPGSGSSTSYLESVFFRRMFWCCVFGGEQISSISWLAFLIREPKTSTRGIGIPVLSW